MKIKTADLTGLTLDWAVGIAQGWTRSTNSMVSYGRRTTSLAPIGFWDEFGADQFLPSTDWAQGGPIIEREISKLFKNVGGSYSAMILKNIPIPPEQRGTSLAITQRMQWNGSGPTPLIAAMRCYVASKLGDEVEVPDELCEE